MDAAAAPTPDPTPPGPGALRVRRRDFVGCGITGLAGLAAGVLTERQLDRLGGPPAPPPPPARAESELDADRRAASKTSYAQCGDDLVISCLLDCFGGIPRPSYLDIGASDPIDSNNTYLFYARGGRGVLVEPNVDLTDKIRRLRPDDTLLVAGIGTDDNPQADYYVFTAWGLNTFDKAQVELLERTTEHRLVRTVKMPLLNINRVIVEHLAGKAPDILSIDIEGLDYAVLKTLDYTRFRPKLICVETIITGTLRHNPETPKLLAEKGYELRGMTFPNMMFADTRAIK